MRVLYIHQYFKTPQEPGGTRSYAMARGLVAAGHEVTMIAQTAAGDRGIVRKRVDGIDVVYIRNQYRNELLPGRKVLAFVRFMVRATCVSSSLKRMDVVIASSTPLSVGVPGLFAKYWTRAPLVFEVRDLWPDAAIQMGVVRRRSVIWILRAFERLIYRCSTHVVALSPGMAEGVMRWVRPEKVTIIPNMARTTGFYGRDRDDKLRKDLRLRKNSLKVVHFGAENPANNLRYLLEAAQLLQEEGVENVEFVLLGAGRCREGLKRFAEEAGLRNVIFLERRNMEGTSAVVNLCDVAAVCFKNVPILATNSPNKLFDALASGKAIVVNSNGWTRDVVERGRCGVYVDGDRPDALAEVLKRWETDREEVTRMGANARVLAEGEFDEKMLVPRFVGVIERVERETREKRRQGRGGSKTNR